MVDIDFVVSGGVVVIIIVVVTAVRSFPICPISVLQDDKRRAFSRRWITFSMFPF